MSSPSQVYNVGIFPFGVNADDVILSAIDFVVEELPRLTQRSDAAIEIT